MSSESGVKRRDFLKIVGATGAATAVVGCTSEKVGRLIPYVVSPDQTVPGVSNYYAPVCRECGGPCAVLAANRAAFGGSSWPRLDFGRARLIISFGADFLDGWGNSAAHQLDWADARAKLENAPRFVYVGPRRSLTGLNADEWIAVKP